MCRNRDDSPDPFYGDDMPLLRRARSIRVRLSLVFLFLFLLVIVLGIEALGSLSCVNDAAAQIRVRWLPSTRALGDAVLKLWGELPTGLQTRLFREATTAQDVKLRPRLAIFLHDQHPRTTAARRVRAIIEPDSLGG